MGSIANAQAIQAADAYGDSCDLGTTNPSATLVFYSGTPPANVDAALAGNTVLGECAMSNPAFGAAADVGGAARITANAISDDTAANADGTPTFCRVLDRDNTPRLQLTVGVAAAEVIVNAVPFVEDANIEVSVLTFDQPEA